MPRLSIFSWCAMAIGFSASWVHLSHAIQLPVPISCAQMGTEIITFIWHSILAHYWERSSPSPNPMHLLVIQLTRQETYGTSSRCSECGSYTRKSGRMLHCESCDIWINRDINACISQAKRGRTRLVRSLLMEKGPPDEAVNQLKDGEQMAGSHILSTGSWQSPPWVKFNTIKF